MSSDVIDFKSRSRIPVTQAQEPGEFEFHLFSDGTPDSDSPGSETPGEVLTATGYLKFGPQFIAVVDGTEDTSSVIFAIQTPLVKYVKRLGTSNETQGTLSL